MCTQHFTEIDVVLVLLLKDKHILGQPISSILKSLVPFSWILNLEDGIDMLPKMLVTNYQSMLCNIQ